MKRTDKREKLSAWLIGFLLCFIWGNSLLPGSVSGALSGWLRDALAFLFPGGTEDPDAGHGLLRKLAHFTEFACLGALLTWLFAMLQKQLLLALAGGCLAAGVDECIQCFVPARGPSVWDVLIDVFGVLLGVSILIIVCAVNNKKQKTFWRNKK